METRATTLISSRMPLILTGMFMLGIAFVGGRAGRAQESTNRCTVLIEQSLTEVNSTCPNLDSNTACFASGEVSVTLYDNTATTGDALSQPGDRVEWSSVQAIYTSTLSTSIEQLGVAIVNLQSDQTVTLWMLGDVALEKANVPTDSPASATSITATVLVDTDVWSQPDSQSAILGRLAQATLVPVDGINADGEWLHILYQESPAWISRASVFIYGAENLPMSTLDSRIAAPAFTLRLAPSSLSSCTDHLPSLLVIHGPEDKEATVVINGAEISLTSTVVLQLGSDNVMILFVLDGRARLGDLLVAEGSAVTVSVSVDGRDLAGLWSDARPLTGDELESLALLENLLASPTMSQPAEPPSPGDLGIIGVETQPPMTGEPTATPEQASPLPDVTTECTVQSDWPIYTVRSGDTLGSIARSTNASIPELAAANCMADADTIYSGQSLYVPILPPPPTPLPAPAPTTSTPCPVTDVSCIGPPVF